jgi:peptide/nickel transport system substrate-binding protein
MKARFNTRSIFAAICATSIAFIGLASLPAQAATRTTVVVTESNPLSSLNPLTPDTNLVTNSDLGYLTGIGFEYYNNKEQVVRNTALGNYSIVKNSDSDFEVKYTINKGLTWSDGVPITAADLLLTHVINSSAYSIKAGLGDPNGTAAPAFNSVNYGSAYDQNVVGVPTISDDGLSLTVKYGLKLANYDIYSPAPFPVHTLVELARGDTSLPSASKGEEDTAQFQKDFYANNTANLLKYGKVWSNSYNIATVDSSTNPLLLVSNGGYILQSAVPSQSATLVVNPTYKDGPALSGITTFIFKYGVSDGSPSAQALSNKEIDVYDGQPTADAVASLKTLPGVATVGYNAADWEHIDLRTGDGAGTTDHYTGPFALSGGQKAADLREAFLLAYPRADIVQKLIQPINSSAQVLQSQWVLPDNANYAKFITGNGSSAYNGTQAARTAQALALVKKYYPTAGKATPINVNLLFGQPSNTRRVSESQLVKAAEAAVGFNVSITPTSGWSSHVEENKWDAEFFAWSQQSVTQAGNCENFKTGGGDNYIGYSNASVDAACKKLEGALLPDSSTLALWQSVERTVTKDAVSLGIFQFPSVVAYNSALVGLLPGPLAPNIVWNYWAWHF